MGTNPTESFTMETSSISIHKDTEDPTLAWESMKEHQQVRKLQVITPTSPPAPNVLRFVCMSDTHALQGQFKFDIPDGDVFLHAGDFTHCGEIQEVKDFSAWLGKLPHKHKVVIAGNHELSFDPAVDPSSKPHWQVQHKDLQDDVSTPEPRALLLKTATYLEDSLTTIAGVKIYGSPWQPAFGGWAFNLPRGAPCLQKWSAIPEGVDVLMTHAPPVGHGDLCSSGKRAGCVELLSTVQNRVKPKYHVFGHIHEGYGVTTDESIMFVNASTCDRHYNPCNPPIVFDVPIPQGFCK